GCGHRHGRSPFRTERARGGRSRPGCARSARTAKATGSAAGRTGDHLHGRLRRRCEASAAGSRRLLRRRSEHGSGQRCRGAARAVFADERRLTLTSRHTRLALEAGALATLPAALLVQSVMLVLFGEFARASEQAFIGSSSRSVPLLHAQLILAAWRGHSDETEQAHTALAEQGEARGHATEVSLAQYGMAVLHNGLGAYGAGRQAAARAFESDELAHSNLAHSE